MIKKDINDKLEIKIKQAPISKIVIYNNKIDIIKGRNNPEILESFLITDEGMKTKFISLPMYINNVINSNDKSLYFLDSLSMNSRLPVPDAKMYEDNDIEKYIKTYGGDYEGNVICLIQQLINPTTIMEFYQKQYNYHSIFQIKIGNAMQARLILDFKKEDCIYTNYKGIKIDYSDPHNNQKIRDNLVQAMKNNKLVSLQKETNTIVTKTLDE